MRVVYETHATNVHNEAGVASGWLPGELSARGRVEAGELGARRHEVDVVYVSDLRRALQTVEIAFEGVEKEVRVDRRLRECGYGMYDGRPAVELAAVRRRYVDEPWPGGGQSYRDVVEGTREFLREVREEWGGATVLVVAHSANLWALRHLVEGVALEELVDAPFAWRPGWEFQVGRTEGDGWGERGQGAVP
ncbi:histidine phosphatase family protein [Nonomuraea sp. NPDC050783]|uniref:histidine phosphatase family protein n=1 Tax=Nonomuraea sp. NPDC050783 TaxID=3154634 RepID=UPI003466D9CA